jgi:hypothetical protein
MIYLEKLKSEKLASPPKSCNYYLISDDNDTYDLPHSSEFPTPYPQTNITYDFKVLFSVHLFVILMTLPMNALQFFIIHIKLLHVSAS